MSTRASLVEAIDRPAGSLAGAGQPRRADTSGRLEGSAGAGAGEEGSRFADQWRLMARLGASPAVRHLAVLQRAANARPEAVRLRRQAEGLGGRRDVVQRTLLPVDGDAPQDEKDFVDRRIREFAGLNPAIQGMIDRLDVRLFVTLNRDEARGDQETRVEYDGGLQRTWILVTLDQGEDDTPEQMASDLLHELVLHGVPAYQEHVAALTAGRAPNFPEGDEEVAEAELHEHGDYDAWFEMARIAVAAGGPWEFKQKVIADWLAHADESGLTEDEQLALHAVHERDWDWLRQEGWLP
jgi:hypothetical protein